ncbi:DUF1116 domain-containing protein [Halanaerobium sp.]|uniref:DUF1116 domain-containing protein n=1 Tax=Halanaerobium sp. TaxID=1895664 RepID=UPI000DE74E4E|nr:DUF1116 domain-containing protein [Halanaerobium sp.]PUU94582.1 MAG: hypothetical protein CI949_684 [Halanaerobium sp.]
MSKINELFAEELNVINIGNPNFKEDLTAQNVEVVGLDWQPPAGGKPELIEALDNLSEHQAEISEANKKVVEILKTSQAKLIGIDQAINVVPGMKKNLILHAGPPVAWEDMCGPMEGAVIGALIYEGLAADEDAARELAASGEIEFAPCHEHSAVGPMAGVMSASMPVHIVENSKYGNKTYCTVNEGLGKVLRYGAFSEEVIDRLKFIETTYAPALKKALALIDGGIDLKAIISQALHMGDECHNRNKASTSLFFREITPYFLEADLEKEVLIDSLKFIKENDHYFLNLSMPTCKAALDAAHGVENSTLVTTMARNGVEFGLRISSLDADQWFTGPAQMVKGLLFPGYTEEDASPDIGDSTITETMGLGGFVMGGAPAIVQFVGGTVDDAINYSKQMYEITEGENNNFSIPTLNFRGSAIGIDVMKVIESGRLPIINTGMAHKVAGVGQVGAGIVNPPAECFEKAIIALSKKIAGSEA